MSRFRCYCCLGVWLIFAGVFLTISSAVAEQSIALSSLGQHPKQFSQVVVVKQVQTRPVTGLVTVRPSSAYQVVLPFTPQQVEFVVVSGQQVKQGQVVAAIAGLNVEHFFKQLNAAKIVYEESVKYRQSIQPLADNKTLKHGEWLAINQRHLEAQLEYEHLSHIRTLLAITEQGQVQLLSPRAGMFNVNTSASSALFSVIPNSEVVVKAQLPVSQAERLIEVISINSDCELQPLAIEQVVHTFHRTVWLQPRSACSLLLGQSIQLKPVVAMSGYLVPIPAVFELNDKDYVAIQQGAKLTLVAVKIISKQGSQYVVRSDVSLQEASVLTSAVSVAQGLFLGLGE